MSKLVYGWVVDWNNTSSVIRDRVGKDAPPNVSIDLFFSSREKFEELLGTTTASEEILVPVYVGDDFNDLDFIPDEY